MINQTPLITMSRSFRAKVVKIWIMGTDLSAAQGAMRLTEVAVTNGFIRRDKSVLGTTLTSWNIGKVETPLWAAKAALSMLLESEWMPSNDEEWAGFATLFLTMNKSTQLADLLMLLPQRLASHVAVTGWLCAAIEEMERFNVVKWYEKKLGKFA
ncbi:hypothetical protein [Xenorhabdus griffiniae]|uniref:Uncharacterized protein n=1 Tax=Xenorhabdus griffiniae TaxID=351672 RepID=A0ABY9XEV6_9GAMM|nr:hypothetical protein [Xenorhabdus griffiniae]MBD1225979.1 hypothetical protein [Xenorhabdus griffiniae]MBE8585903.1 hypothetical protein [Xenorhabdus griffiniae]WMV71447.1 hypothetical protein QL128_14905 [Xenorhabdus griffiniae]WNH01124.1 hypothetical protein QL112_014910 [Xenorhabdus griffiniae]